MHVCVCVSHMTDVTSLRFAYDANHMIMMSSAFTFHSCHVGICGMTSFVFTLHEHHVIMIHFTLAFHRHVIIIFALGLHSAYIITFTCES